MSDPQPVDRNVTATIESLVLVIAVAASVSLIGWVVWRAGFAFDFSDEGYYLFWIATPRSYNASVTQFGFIYHPLYELTGGDITLLRRINILLTLGLGWLLCWVVFRKLTPSVTPTADRTDPRLAAVALVLSTSTLALLDMWLPTPSYNSLAFQALLLAGTGMLLAETRSSLQSIVGWVVIGISGWLAFMAKPTTAAALVVVLGLYLLLAGKFKFRMLVISLGTVSALGFISAWVIDGSIQGFVGRLVLGVNDLDELRSGHTIAGSLRMDDFSLGNNEKYALALATLLVFLATTLGVSIHRAKQLSSAALTLIFSLIGLAISLGLFAPSLRQTNFLSLQFLALPFGILLGTLAISYRNRPRQVPFERLALALSFGAFPYLYAFGANQNYWTRTPAAAIFWVLAAIAFLGVLHGQSISWRVLLPVAAGAQLCTTTLLFHSMEYPYRQTQPLRENCNVIKIAGTQSKLLVSQGFADYVEKLHQLAAAGGFKVGEPMLDLTGNSPGALYAMGAKSVGRPWMIGGYQGSDRLAIVTLDRVPRMELQRAWILTEPTGPRKLSAAILKRYGLDLTKDYVEVGTLDSPTGTFPSSYKQQLLKPAK